MTCSSGPSSSSGSSSVSSSSIPGSPSGSPVHHHHHPHLQDDFLRSEAFKTEVQGKLVTLEELVHMRRVLTAASVENLPLDSTIKDDVENGKVFKILDFLSNFFPIFNESILNFRCVLCAGRPAYPSSAIGGTDAKYVDGQSAGNAAPRSKFRQHHSIPSPSRNSTALPVHPHCTLLRKLTLRPTLRHLPVSYHLGSCRNSGLTLRVDRS